MAEQTQQFRGQLTQVVLTSPAQAGDANPRVLARLRDLEQSLDILSRLALGDQTALAAAGVQTQGAYDTQAHEWALGRDRGDRTTCYLIAGGPGEVNWEHPALTGLASIAHSHPFVPTDRKDFVPNTGPQVLQTLTAGLTPTAGKIIVPTLPGDLWYLFPSNQDLVAGYVGDFERPEVVYSPYRLAPDGRLSRNQGDWLYVKYGPVLATLMPNADVTIKSSPMDAKSDVGLKAIESSCFQYVWCALEFFVGRKSVLRGFMQAAPKYGNKTPLVELAWFQQSGIPANAMKRSQVLDHIRALKS